MAAAAEARVMLPKPPKRVPKPRQRIVRHVRPRVRKRGKASDLQLDALWSRRVLASYAGACWMCPKQATDAHHIFGKKAHPATRWDLDNGAPLCRPDHQAVHRDPTGFHRVVSLWFLTEGRYEALRVRSLRTGRVDRAAALATLEAAA